mgnify:CR=1 FL=1
MSAGVHIENVGAVLEVCAVFVNASPDVVYRQSIAQYICFCYKNYIAVRQDLLTAGRTGWLSGAGRLWRKHWSRVLCLLEEIPFCKQAYIIHKGLDIILLRAFQVILEGSKEKVCQQGGKDRDVDFVSASSFFRFF